MSSRFFHQSKFRHLYPIPAKADQIIEMQHVSRSCWDSNLIKCNPKFAAINWESPGSGAVAIISLEQNIIFDDGNPYPLLAGHKQAVLNCGFSPSMTI